MLKNMEKETLKRDKALLHRFNAFQANVWELSNTNSIDQFMQSDYYKAEPVEQISEIISKQQIDDLNEFTKALNVLDKKVVGVYQRSCFVKRMFLKFIERLFVKHFLA